MEVRILRELALDILFSLHFPTPGLAHRHKVLKLAPSHFQPWEDYRGNNLDEIENLFANAVTPLVPDWKEKKDGLLSEILLLEGFPLHSKVDKREDFKKNEVREVSCDFHENKLLVCLDEKLKKETVDSLEIPDGCIFVCLDSAIDDSFKATLADKGLVKTL